MATRPANPTRGSTTARVARTKATEACERCREKRIKCNGLRPCSQCTKKDLDCIFAFTPANVAGGNELIAEKLDLVLARLEQIEQQLSRQAESTSRVTGRDSLIPQSRGITQINQLTGCFEYYGRTSTFGIASSLGKRLKFLETVSGSPPPTKRRRIAVNLDYADLRDDDPDALGLDDLTSCYDYVVPPNSLRTDRYLREAVADRHLESFFNTIHMFLPMLDAVIFRARYISLRRLFGDRRLMFATSNDTSRPQFVCLLHAVLALGALYEDGQEDSSSWASWYFAEAQDMLGRLLDASNLHLVQAATFLGAYAQHAIKPNRKAPDNAWWLVITALVAYILTGIATRLAFSIGLNVETLHASLGFDSQEARRTWSIIYIQEVELSLDAGRPMSLQSSEMNMNYPTVKLPTGNETSAEPAQVVFIRYLAELAKIVKSGDGGQLISTPEQREVLRQRLETWCASLPEYLSFCSPSTSTSQSQPPVNFLRDWKLRQQSSLRIHYNIAIITLMRNVATGKSTVHNITDGDALDILHQRVCLNAAQDMIEHIHQSFEIAPGLRRWSYYCFYCLQAVLVLLPKVADNSAQYRRQHRTRGHDADNADPAPATDIAVFEKHKRLCDMAIEVFGRIQLKASRRCADVVRQFLERWAAQTGHHNTRAANVPATGEGTHHPASMVGLGRVPHDPTSAPASRDFTDLQYNSMPTADTVEHDSGSGGLAQSTNGSSYTSPPVSINGLQAELYSALYCSDPNDSFLVANQLVSFNFDYFDNGQAIAESQDDAGSTWQQTEEHLERTQSPYHAWPIFDGASEG